MCNAALQQESSAAEQESDGENCSIELTSRSCEWVWPKAHVDIPEYGLKPTFINKHRNIEHPHPNVLRAKMLFPAWEWSPFSDKFRTSSADG